MIGWGVLGNATIARLAVVPAIAHSSNGRIVTIGSRSLDRAKQLTDSLGGTPVSDYEAVLADPAVQAVYIPLPNHLHKEWTLKALSAGKHVLVEKPFAMNSAEATEMVQAAKAQQLHLAEAFMWRHHPRSQQIYQLVSSGKLGKIGSIRAAFTFPVQPNAQNGRLFSAEMGGGSLWDVGSYGVSLARWMFGAEPVSVSAQAVWNEAGVDINFVGSLAFECGGLAVVESGFQSALQQTYSILGDKTAVEFNQHDAFIPKGNTAIFSLRPFDKETGQEITVKNVDQYQLMVEDFADVILGEKQPRFSPEDSIRQMQVLDALKLAAQTGKAISLQQKGNL
ncbi:MAG: Gfo/Idh/MocA family oxidoreductase [Chloroflexota bacterium]